MAVIIHKIELIDGEMLPDVVDTQLWDALDPFNRHKSKKPDRQVAGLYAAIAQRENYFQENTPTAFGNPEYNLYCGVVNGFLQAMEATETEEDGHIVIRYNNMALLIVDKLVRPQRYYECARENREVLIDLGL